MARSCHYCEKKRLVGMNVSHSNNRTKKRSYPNLQKVHALFEGAVRRVYACTRCIRSGLVQKAA
ncbi:MAG: 50S ribosomal protein L28 [Deltaproteobacteria bacterium]|nr:50S ribosomal protein L28 [Deltaproteobacteria bacterium]